jgi:U3 small nucleolar RNA-associated protein 4
MTCVEHTSSTSTRCRSVFGHSSDYHILTYLQHHCVLPSLPQPAQTLAFDPSAPHLLILGMANNTFQVFDVEARHQPDWARSLVANLPKRFTHIHDAILGVTFDPGALSAPASSDVPSTLRPRHALFWGSTWLCKVQLNAPVGWGGFSKKRYRNAVKPPPSAPGRPNPTSDGTIGESNFKLATHYRPILFADFIGPGELVIVERPPVDVLSKLPPAFWKPKYGAS